MTGDLLLFLFDPTATSNLSRYFFDEDVPVRGFFVSVCTRQDMQQRVYDSLPAIFLICNKMA